MFWASELTSSFLAVTTSVGAEVVVCVSYLPVPAGTGAGSVSWGR